MIDFKNGRAEWIRTTDLSHPKGVRYRSAPQPELL